MKKTFCFTCLFANSVFATDLEGGSLNVIGKNQKMQTSNLKDEVSQTEVFSTEDMRKTGTTNLIDSLKNNVGISEQNDCSVCGARGISLNQLPSGYTTIMIDGVPLFSTVSSVYGLDVIDTNGVQAVEVARGANANIATPEALAGTVNIVTKKPTENLFSTQIVGGSYGTKEAMFYGSNIFKNGSISISASHKEREPLDGDGNKISESPRYERRNMSASLFLNNILGFDSKTIFLSGSDDRIGGATIRDMGIATTDNSGNPFLFGNTKNGDANYSYNDGYRGFTERIITNRKQITSTGEKKTSFGSARIAFGLAEHSQDSYYAGDIYDATQNQTYFENSYKINLKTNNPSQLTVGFNHTFQNLKSKGRVYQSTTITDGIDNFSYNTYGIFTNLYNSFFNDKLETNLASRYDYHSEFGSIWTPKINTSFKHNSQLTSRASIGTGYRVPTSYFEFEHGILSVAKIERNITDVEKSQNANYSLTFQGERSSFTGGYSYTKIKNIAHISLEDGLDHAIFESSNNPVTIQNFEAVFGYLLTPSISGKLGFEHNHFNFTQGDLPIARPKNRIFLSLDKDFSAKIQATFRANWTGQQDLDDFYGTRYNLDGTKKDDKSPAFTTFDFLFNFKLAEGHSLICGVNNILDYKQVDKDSQIFIRPNGEMDVNNIWGPNLGRYIYANYKIDLK